MAEKLYTILALFGIILQANGSITCNLQVSINGVTNGNLIIEATVGDTAVVTCSCSEINYLTYLTRINLKNYTTSIPLLIGIGHQTMNEILLDPLSFTCCQHNQTFHCSATRFLNVIQSEPITSSSTIPSSSQCIPPSSSTLADADSTYSSSIKSIISSVDISPSSSITSDNEQLVLSTANTEVSTTLHTETSTIVQTSATLTANTDASSILHTNLSPTVQTDVPTTAADGPGVVTITKIMSSCPTVQTITELMSPSPLMTTVSPRGPEATANTFSKAEAHLNVNDTVIASPSGATVNILPGDRVYFNCNYATNLITYLYKGSITGGGMPIFGDTFNGTVWTTQVLTCCHHIKVWNCSLPTILNVLQQENMTSNCSSAISPTPSLSLTMNSLLTSTEIEESSSYTIMASSYTEPTSSSSYTGLTSSYTDITNTESISSTESIEPISYTELASGYTESASSVVTVTECIMTSTPLPTPTTITILRTVFTEPTATSETQYTFSECFSNNSGIIALTLTTFVSIILLIILGSILMVICCCCRSINRKEQTSRGKAGYHDDNDQL
uniref:Sushi domain-containing protein n=1 Tax=Amphimedon queenslandica TaxID=400682 RepID=A0A1X7UEH7_AMPQE